MKKQYLHNVKSRFELEAALAAETFARIPVSFYRYFKVSDPQKLRDELYLLWDNLNVKGRVYVAHEGVNAQLSVPEFNVEAFKQKTQSRVEFDQVFLNFSKDQGHKAFIKLIVRVREKIVQDGLKTDVFEKAAPGERLNPLAFHEKLKEPGVVVIDARNSYECETGHFEGAYLPKSETFSEMLPELSQNLKDHKDKTVLMYCTGGIRCEKASSFLKSEGFKNVFHLFGGVVNYLGVTKENNIDPKFKGSLFVFDGRLSEPVVGEVKGKCYQCGAAHSVHRDCSNVECHTLMIQCPSCEDTYKGYCKSCVEAGWGTDRTHLGGFEKEPSKKEPSKKEPSS